MHSFHKFQGEDDFEEVTFGAIVVYKRFLAFIYCIDNMRVNQLYPIYRNTKMSQDVHY